MHSSFIQKHKQENFERGQKCHFLLVPQCEAAAFSLSRGGGPSFRTVPDQNLLLSSLTQLSAKVCVFLAKQCFIVKVWDFVLHSGISYKVLRKRLC